MFTCFISLFYNLKCDFQSKYKPNQTKMSPKKEAPSENKSSAATKASNKGNQIASMFARQTKKSDDPKEEGKGVEVKSKVNIST